MVRMIPPSIVDLVVNATDNFGGFSHGLFDEFHLFLLSTLLIGKSV
jgi:hypothetical protein